MTALALLSAPSSLPRRLLAPVVDPKVFDFWASRVHPAWSWARPLAQIVERHRASADAVTLVLRPNRHWTGFRPGQHVNLGVEVDGIRLTRSYSPSAVPGRGGRIAITVRQVDGGKVSTQLCRDARIGDVMEIGPAFGAMTLDDAPACPRLFLAAGSGITPLMAMLRQRAAQPMPAPLTLVYWARRRAELCFTDELRALAQCDVGFRLHFGLTGETPDQPDEFTGRIDPALLAALVPDLALQRVYACGPGGFVDAARAACATAQAFDAEAFTPPPRAIDESGSVQVTLARSGRVLELPRGEPLLTALEAQGFKPASGCRMGICNTCACGKASGSTRHLHTGVAEHEPVSALRLCVNGAASDLVLDL